MNTSAKTRKENKPFFLYFHFSPSFLSTYYVSLRVKSNEGNGKEGDWKEVVRTVREMRRLFSANGTTVLIAFL